MMTCQLNCCRSRIPLEESLKKEMGMRWALKRGQLWKQSKGAWRASQGKGEWNVQDRMGSKPEGSQRPCSGGNLIVEECYFSAMRMGLDSSSHSGTCSEKG